MLSELKIGDVRRFWLGPGYICTGTIISFDNDLVLVKWIYPKPNSWEKISNII